MLVRSVAGLTLLELLVTLSILLILQCVAMPSLHHFLIWTLDK
ncbi:prepilin-type N-terminal cleavage/methylation domain-containing protein [Candidiatus Paracoxiella cheracis]